MEIYQDSAVENYNNTTIKSMFYNFEHSSLSVFKKKHWLSGLNSQNAC